MEFMRFHNSETGVSSGHFKGIVGQFLTGGSMTGRKQDKPLKATVIDYNTVIRVDYLCKISILVIQALDIDVFIKPNLCPLALIRLKGATGIDSPSSLI